MRLRGGVGDDMRMPQVVRTALGELPYPWEDETSEVLMHKLGFMRAGIVSMLQRESARRPTLDAVLLLWRGTLQPTQTGRAL